MDWKGDHVWGGLQAVCLPASGGLDIEFGSRVQWSLG